MLVDARHGIKAVDEEILTLLTKSAVTFQIVLTKGDKPKAAALSAVMDQVREKLSAYPAAYPEIVLTSSETGDGIPTLRSIIAGMV